MRYVVELRVTVIDDNEYERWGLAQKLDEQDGIAVVRQLSQDEAEARSNEWFGEFDVALVEVVDEFAPGEVGTDLYSGITALNRLRPLAVTTVALAPNHSHPLVEQRLFEVGTNYMYRRHKVMDHEFLAAKLSRPDDDHRVHAVDAATLDVFGAKLAQLQEALRSFEGSELHGHLREDLTATELYDTDVISRRSLNGLLARVRRSGFVGTRSERDRDSLIGFRSIKGHLMRINGRSDNPSSDHDKVPNP
jgi:hypothetical protein